MLNRMRWRLVAVSMAAVLAVLLIVMGVINVTLSLAVTGRQDMALASLSQIDPQEEGPEALESAASAANLLGPPPIEAQYAMRFFSVRYDASGALASVTTDNVASVTQDQAIECATEVLEQGKASGTMGEYRFAVESTGEGTTVTFLNIASETQMLNLVRMASAAVSLVMMLLIFVLLVFFSKRATMPYVRNYEAQKRFITDASHELKTPLTSISTSADVLVAEHEGDEWVENIQRQTVRMSKLINSMVVLSRLNEAVPFPERFDFSLSEAAWETAEPFALRAQGEGRGFEQQIQEGLTLNGNRDAVQQMISILLDNALRYSTDEVPISLKVFSKGKRCCIQVANACEPLTSDDLKHLFDRFYRPDQSRASQKGGTGIGLSIVKATAEGHGGSVSVKCPDERRILFTVLL